MRKTFSLLLVVLFLSTPVLRPAQAASSNAGSVVMYGGIILAAVEGINLLYHGIKYLLTREKKPPIKPVQPISTNIQIAPATNLIVTTETNPQVSVETNVPLPVVRIPLSAPVLHTPENASFTTNRDILFSWSRVPSTMGEVQYRLVVDDETNLVASTNYQEQFILGRHRWWVQALEDKTNEGLRSRIIAFTVITNRTLFVSTSILSNLTENEKEDIRLFGPDHYYQVSLAYYKVKKMEKSREFMFHSLAIGIKVEEGTLFLKEKFKLTDKQIQEGVTRYRNPSVRQENK